MFHDRVGGDKSDVTRALGVPPAHVRRFEDDANLENRAPCFNADVVALASGRVFSESAKIHSTKCLVVRPSAGGSVPCWADLFSVPPAFFLLASAGIGLHDNVG